MDIKLFDYDLPPELIAQTPLKDRATSRMLFVDQVKHEYRDEHFYNIISHLKSGDVIVRNNTKVIPARLFGFKEETLAKVEVLLLTPVEKDTYECIVGNAKVVKVGTKIIFQAGVLEGECLETKDEGLRIIRFYYHTATLLETLDEIGKMPLPPYIHEELKEKDRYQTIYAKVSGSAAAPTAGFHFTREIEQQLIYKGVEILEITLHVGLGTFRPVKVQETDDHVMHEEYYEIDEITAKKLNEAKASNRRIIAVGTTSLRALESNFQKHGSFVSEKAWTNLFILPGFKVLSVDGLLTNFHLPKSTLLMLVSALLTREFTLELYRHAVVEKYRFFSFGDCMLIL